jgi:hypothetical protein
VILSTEKAMTVWAAIALAVVLATIVIGGCS